MTHICLKGLQNVNKNIARQMLSCLMDLKGVSVSLILLEKSGVMCCVRGQVLLSLWAQNSVGTSHKVVWGFHKKVT